MQFPLTATILFIDDDANFSRTVKDYFEDNGFTLVEASSGQAGLELFRQQKPEVVVVDLQMPGVGGLEVLRTLTKEAPQIPVLVISDSGGLEDVIQALRIGAWDYLTKPMPQVSILEHAVCRALERSRLIEENKIYREKLEQANQALQKNLAILEQDQEAGRSVQMKLLPEQGTVLGDYYFSHHIAPSLYLSGDFVDYFKIDDARFAFYIADVSGHGASSAFVTVLLKSIMAQILARHTAHQDETILAPEAVLAKLGAEIHAAKLGKYLTMIYGVIDITTHTLEYSIGGHYPNPILLESNKARFLEGKGFPVGIMKSAVYSRYRVHLTPQVRLLMFSDGIAEILPEKDMEHKEKLLLSMAEKGQCSIEYFIQQLGLHDKQSLPDDVTILTLRHEPPP